MVKKLIRCTQCNKIIPQFASFGDFGESSLLPGVEWSSEDLEEQKEFSRVHQGHILEDLFIDPETFTSNKPSYEPVKDAYFEASNGKERFLVKRTRKSIDRPVFYELVPGKMKVSDVSVEIHEDEILEETSWLNGSLPLPADKVKKFIQAFLAEVESIPPETLGEEIEDALPGETALLKYGSFRDTRWKRVLRRCENDFHQTEMEWIEKLIHSNQQPDKILGLRIKKRVSISLGEGKPII